MRYLRLLAIAVVACKEPAPRTPPLDLSFEQARGLVADTCATPLAISSAHDHDRKGNALGIAATRILTCELRATWGPEHAGGIARGLVTTISLDREGRPIHVDVGANVDNAHAQAFAHHVLERFLEDRELARSRLSAAPSTPAGQVITVGKREAVIAFEPAPADPSSTFVRMLMRHP